MQTFYDIFHQLSASKLSQHFCEKKSEFNSSSFLTKIPAATNNLCMEESREELGCTEQKGHEEFEEGKYENKTKVKSDWLGRLLKSPIFVLH